MSLKAIALILAPCFCASADLDGDCSSDNALSFLQTKAIQKQASVSLQAPPEGGPFSEFFNNRIEGNGIHKWLQYFPAYERHLKKFIGKEVHIVEIGIQSGGSMEMWKGVFGPGAHVYGVDINPACKSYEDNQTKIFIGDQENAVFWGEFVTQVPRIDILVDDGGHTVEQQMATLGIMLPHLSPDGVFITEDVHGENNPFWQRLNFGYLSSPEGKLYTGLQSVISSVHVYPYLLVVELKKNTGGQALLRQLGADESSAKPSDIRVAVAAEQSLPTSAKMRKDLYSVFPELKLQTEEISQDGNVVSLLYQMQPGGWLFVRDGKGQFSFDALWDDETGVFMSKIITDFNMMHQGTCCDPATNDMQQAVDSLHFYPHLAIAQRTSGTRLIQAPRHGTRWIPY